MRRLRVLLNSGFSGPHAGFFLAEANGHFTHAGLSIEWLAGAGAAAVVPHLVDGSCDAAYGDLNALIILLSSLPPESGPISPFVAFNRTPLTIAVNKHGPVRLPADLAGRTVSGHARDAALIVFPALAKAAGIDPRQVKILPSPASLGEQVRRMVVEQAADGVFGFVNTIIASMSESRIDLEDQISFIEYADSLPDLYGNALIVTRALYNQEPQTVQALAQAAASGFRDAAADPEAGIVAVKLRKPDLDTAINLRRWKGTLAREMAHPERAIFGLGGADPLRVERSARIMCEALGLPRQPAASEIYANSFAANGQTGFPAEV